MAKYGCTVARADFYPVLLPLPASNASERHGFRSEVETIQRDDLLAENHPCRRSVVSDGIRKFDLPLCDPAVNEVQRRADPACCGQDSINGDTWTLQVLGEPERDLRLD